MSRVKRTAWGLLLMGLIAAFVPTVIEVLKNALAHGDGIRATAFGLACVIGIVAFATRPLQFLHVFIHESAHAVATIISGHKIGEFHASADGNGHVRMNQSNIFISVAPYSLALSPIVLLLISNMVSSHAGLIFVGLSGLLFGDHILCAFRDFRPYQPDIQQYGFVLSLCFVGLLNMISVSIVALLLRDAPASDFASFFTDGGQRITTVAKTVWASL